MSKENSHLTIREDLIAEGYLVPVSLLSVGDYDPIHIKDTPYLDIICEHASDGQLDDNGSNLLVRITDPTQFDSEGEPIKDRLAFAINADYDWN
tara:strand:- start:215 stop:496 length:282 start_codon:yes stop_codon:yes gene_type:complete